MAQIQEQGRLEAAADFAMPDESLLRRKAVERLAKGKISVNLNAPNVQLKYSSDVDLLTIRFIERPRPNRCESDFEADVLYNYDEDKLVSVEILDITERFVDAGTVTEDYS